MTSFKQVPFLSSVIFYTFLFATVNALAIIPPSRGSYGVGLSIDKLTDEKRMDPYNPEQYRSIMLSSFYPVGSLAECDPEIVEYMPPSTAQIQDEYYSQYGLRNGTFESLRLSLCNAPCQTDSYPLILFSPGLGNSRLIYSALAQSLASNGYSVLAMDHPHDANVVEYPDGTLILGANITTGAQIEQALAARVKDVSFILDQLSRPSTALNLIPSTHQAFNTTHVLIVGHSLGGATAAQAMLSDSRLIGGVNLDGTFFGSVITRGLDRPFLVFGHEGKNQSTDASWKELWGNLRGWRRELGVEGSQHASFTDLPVLVDVLGLRERLPGVDGVLGTIGGERAREVVSACVVAFADFMRGVGGEKLFEGRVKAYPEVSVVAK